MSTGSPPKPRARPDRRTIVDPVRRRALAALLLASLFPLAAAGQGDLLPAERAFALSARGLDERTIEVRFAIARGYYLYRDKFRFGVAPGALAAAPLLPRGQMKDDEFFGRVETYRTSVAVRLTLDRPAPGEQVTLNAESQGCADVGVCYPPHAQTLVLTLPAAGRGAGPAVEAAPPKKSWFN